MDKQRESITDKTFHGQGRRLFGVLNLSSLCVQNCLFENCSFGYNRSIFGGQRDVISDTELMSCRTAKSLVGGAVLRKIKVRDLSGDMLICRGTLFDQVVLSGKISPMMLHGVKKAGLSDEQVQSLEKERRSFYQNVEFALDISGAEFVDFSIRTGAIPSSLVRRDKTTQFLVLNSERTLSAAVIDQIDVSTYTRTVLKLMVEEEQVDTILIAPKGDKTLFETVMRDSDVLRKNGLLALD